MIITIKRLLMLLMCDNTTFRVKLSRIMPRYNMLSCYMYVPLELNEISKLYNKVIL